MASRRKAEELITIGMVSVNGKTVTELGIKINPNKDKVDKTKQYILKLT